MTSERSGSAGRRASPKPESKARIEATDIELARRMKAIRKLKGHTLESAAAFIGVTFQQLHKYETAHSRIAAPRLKELANAYGIDINLFFEPADGKKTHRQVPMSFSAKTIRMAQAFDEIKDEGLRNAIVALLETEAARSKRLKDRN